MTEVLIPDEVSTELPRPPKRQVCLIGTYPPRLCGIATFTADLHASLQAEGKIHSNVVALTGAAHAAQYPPEVAFEIRQNHLADYRLAAEYINFSGADVISLQHEFGIFGGAEGRYVFELLENLRAPVVTTLHTVLPEPNPGYLDSLIRTAELSDHLVVMNGRAIPILENVYGISPNKVSVIHHGVPDVPFIDPNYHKDKFGVEGKLVLLTFGLLSRSKGIEFMLEALPALVKRHPNIVYLVLGATHPEVKRRQGEEYRLFLQRRVSELGLDDHVIFHDRYVNLQELTEFIGACDIYITPYQSKDQIVSGTLAYALGMGKAVVSTPYLYAEELLAEGRGRLVKFGDPAELSNTLIELVENDAERHQMRKRAYEYGRDMTWSSVAQRYQELYELMAASSPLRDVTRQTSRRRALDLREVKLDHLEGLTDDTGIIQHATYAIPNRRSGYSTDDQARALVAALRHYEQFADDRALPLITNYLSFLQFAQLPNGRFHNFMDYGRRFLDEVGGEDTQGRALWGLGVAVALGPTPGIRALARELFEKGLHRLKLTHPRALAYAICGLHAFLTRYDGAARERTKLEQFATRLADIYDRAQADDWNWFGDEMTYASAKMPQAMLLAADLTENPTFLRIGVDSLEFLLSHTFSDGQFDFPGNRGWLRRDGTRAIFDQQPIEAGYLAEALISAAEITHESKYSRLAVAAIEWLMGRNRLGLPLFDLATGACNDGLDRRGVNLNQGAESVICCVLGLLAVSGRYERRANPENQLVLAASAAGD
jgi:glycosyltransferase involved in cell wall biosynthesis